MRTELTLHRVATRRPSRAALSDTFLKFGLILFIALIFTLADAFSATCGPEGCAAADPAKAEARG